jgi:hypothetical protein
MRSVNLNESLGAWPQVGSGVLGTWFYVVLDYSPWPLGSLRTKHLPETPEAEGTGSVVVLEIILCRPLGLDTLAMA